MPWGAGVNKIAISAMVEQLKAKGREHVFLAEDEISVSEKVPNGWRYHRGKYTVIGFYHDGDVSQVIKEVLESNEEGSQGGMFYVSPDPDLKEVCVFLFGFDLLIKS